MYRLALAFISVFVIMNVSWAKPAAPSPIEVIRAVRSGNLELLKQQRYRGANFNARDQAGLTPLLVAVGLGNLAMTEYLLMEGADPLALDRITGAAPLNRAAQSGNVKIAELLLKHGALIDHQAAKNGHTALDLARAHGRDKIVSILLEGCSEK